MDPKAVTRRRGVRGLVDGAMVHAMTPWGLSTGFAKSWDRWFVGRPANKRAEKLQGTVAGAGSRSVVRTLHKIPNVFSKWKKRLPNQT